MWEYKGLSPSSQFGTTLKGSPSPPAGPVAASAVPALPTSSYLSSPASLTPRRWGVQEHPRYVLGTHTSSSPPASCNEVSAHMLPSHSGFPKEPYLNSSHPTPTPGLSPALTHLPLSFMRPALCHLTKLPCCISFSPYRNLLSQFPSANCTVRNVFFLQQVRENFKGNLLSHVTSPEKGWLQGSFIAA